MQVGGSQEDLLQGLSPSSTIRDLEAACGPLSAASGPLDASALPSSQAAAILPLLWARFTGTLAFMSESFHGQGMLILKHVLCIHNQYDYYWHAGRWAWHCYSWPFRRKKKRYRSIPGVPKQFKLLLRRAGVKWVRGWSYKFIDMLLFVGAALVVGMLVAVLVTRFHKLCALQCFAIDLFGQLIDELIK